MQAITLPRLVDVPGDQLSARLYELRRRERHLQVEFLAYLGGRELHLELGFSSLFAYCVEYLGLSRSATFRRITATRLLTKFPAVAEYLADGRLSLTTLVELREVLEETRLDEILGRAAGKSEDDVKILVGSPGPPRPRCCGGCPRLRRPQRPSRHRHRRLPGSSRSRRSNMSCA
jgi:hypothetical protein